VIEGVVGGAPKGVIEGHDCLEALSRGTGRHEQKGRNCAFNALSASSISMGASTDPSQPQVSQLDLSLCHLQGWQLREGDFRGVLSS